MNSDNDEILDFDRNKSSSFSRIKPKQQKKTFNPIEILGNQKENFQSFVENRRTDVFSSIIINKDPSELKEIDRVSHHSHVFNEVRDGLEENPCDIPYEIEDLRANKSRYPPLIESLLGKVTISELTKEIGFHLIKSTKNMRILQDDSKGNTFKAFIVLNYDLLTILSCFIDGNNYRNWNNTVTEHRMVQMIEPMNSMIIQEKRDYGLSLYKMRSFYYSRTMIPLNNMSQFIIIDKSIPTGANANAGFWESMATIHYNIIAILPHQHNSQSHLVIAWTQVDNQGFLLTGNQNKELNIKFLSQFANLDNFLEQRSFFQNNLKNEIYGRFSFLKGNFSQSSIQLNSENNVILTPQNTQFINQKTLEKSQEFELLFEKTDESQTKDKKNLSFLIENPLNDQKIITNGQFTKDEEFKEEEFKSARLKVPFEELNPSSNLKQSPPPPSTNLLELMRTNQYIIQILHHYYLQSPINLPQNSIKYQQISSETGHYAINKDWSHAKEGGLLWYNKKELEIQGKVISYLLKRLGANLLQGKSVINISLPVVLFDTKSFLERIAYSYTYAPYFLEPQPMNLDAKSHDFQRPGLYQIYQVLCFILSSLHLTISQKKPFNPILGETFQGWIKGSPIYCEQISHHPPISSFLMIGNGYKIQGNFEITASMNPNTVIGKQLGLGQVVFTEKSENSKMIFFSFPPCMVHGIAFGNRIVNYEGKLWIFDAVEKLAMELTFNPDKKGMISGMFTRQKTANDYFKGVVYEMKDTGIEKMMKGILNKKYNGINFKEDVSSMAEVSVCEGIWHEYMEIKGKRYWEFNNFMAYQLEYEEKALPSDCLYREDLIVWRSQDVEEAQKMKEKLEVVQRNDRKLRDKGGGGKKH